MAAIGSSKTAARRSVATVLRTFWGPRQRCREIAYGEADQQHHGDASGDLATIEERERRVGDDAETAFQAADQRLPAEPQDERTHAPAHHRGCGHPEAPRQTNTRGGLTKLYENRRSFGRGTAAASEYCHEGAKG